ncbi:nucleotide exchange factor GrpE [Treponema sp.]|uniref:nucleotide exchange factor GrpE n=1 Tax=Treponema sp. TaxID=166 RepID=UPI0025DE5EA9|nr:nucleotide exchange factor GrpE [Treponema sp.]MCR5217625.1 nucleotide exchange factor GrpE [Treponema sp.]
MANEEKKEQEEVKEETQTSQAQDEQQEATQTEEAAEQKEEVPEDELTVLKNKVDQLEKENADLKDQVLRRAADFENYRKRMIQEKQDAFDFANTNLLKDLLDSLDNFDRTVEAAATATDPKSIADGVSMISKSMVSMLENKYNLVSYGAVGDAFDPNIHEAIGMQEGDVDEEKLAAVYLKGYKLKDRVIRHAKVMVTKPKA